MLETPPVLADEESSRGLRAAVDTDREEDVEVESASSSGTSALTPRQQRNHRVQDVFSAVLAEIGRQGYASAEAVTDEQPMEEQIATSWFDWFDSERQGGRYAQLTEADSLKQSYGDILLRAYDEHGHAMPKEYLASLSQDELSAVQRAHLLAEGIDVDSLTEEGAVNLLVPPAAQVDLNHDGLTQSGEAYGIRFPDSTTPPEVVQAWEEATAGMSWGEKAVHELQMKMPLLTANIICDENGRFLCQREPGDPDFVNPMASSDYSYVQATQDCLDYLEAFRDRIPTEQYDRDKAFFTDFQERLVRAQAI